MEQALTARPLRLTRRRKRVLAQVADPGVVLGVGVAVVVAAAAIAGSLSLNRKMILRVPKKLGDGDESKELGTGSNFYWKSPKTKNGTVVHFFP